MFNLRTLARSLIAGIFIVGGWDSVQNPVPKAAVAEQVGVPVAEKIGLSRTDPVALVRINGLNQLAGGLMLVFGWLPRVASLLLGASLIPTTIGGHRFWDVEDDEERKRQTLQALKNASILGGLVMTALDHGGRPSVFWATRKAADEAARSIEATIEKVAD
jgi:putative oxidoreductase